MMKQCAIFNKAETYSQGDSGKITLTVPGKSIFAVWEGEYIVPTLLPREYTEVEAIVKAADPLDLAIVEEIARSKYLNAFQLYEWLILRGFSISRPELTKKIFKLKHYRVIKESVITIPEAKKGLCYYELDAKGYFMAMDRGVEFHRGNFYRSHTKKVAQGKLETPSDVKRILMANQIVLHMLVNKVKLERFGIMETFLVKGEDGLVNDGSIMRTAANIRIDSNSVLAYEVVRDNAEGYTKLADKMERYYTLLHNANYLAQNSPNQVSLPQVVICGESLEHNRKIMRFLKSKDLWREEDPILFTEDLLNIKDSAHSIYALDEKEECIWYSLPLKDDKEEEERVSA